LQISNHFHDSLPRDVKLSTFIIVSTVATRRSAERFRARFDWGMSTNPYEIREGASWCSSWFELAMVWTSVRSWNWIQPRWPAKVSSALMIITVVWRRIERGCNMTPFKIPAGRLHWSLMSLEPERKIKGIQLESN
jgi:hypothetical protein